MYSTPAAKYFQWWGSMTVINCITITCEMLVPLVYTHILSIWCRITSSEGDTTTSSQFIERQRQELMEYMKSLENQIGELETLKVISTDIIICGGTNAVMITTAHGLNLDQVWCLLLAFDIVIPLTDHVASRRIAMSNACKSDQTWSRLYSLVISCQTNQIVCLSPFITQIDEIVFIPQNDWHDVISCYISNFHYP